MTDQKTIGLAAWGGMALLSLIWGASFLANRVALEEAGVMTTVAVRVGGAAVVLWGVVLYLSVLASAVAYLIFYRLLRSAGAGNTSLVTLTIAPVAVVLGAIAYGEALPLRAYAGFAVLALGLAVLDGRLLGPGAARERAA